MIRVFIDSSALFAASISSTGAARELIRLAVDEEIQLIISADIITERRHNIYRKAPGLGPLFDRLLATIIFEVVPNREKRAVRMAKTCVAIKDVFIIAAAINADVAHVATFDRKHLIDPPEVSEKCGLHIKRRRCI